MKMELTCDNCGKEYSSYQCGKYHHFCSIACRRQAGKLVASSFSKEFRKQKSKQFTAMNRTLMTDSKYIERRRTSFMKNHPSQGYTKYHGKHLHRVVMERKLGRKLKANEIVHHIDGNKQNNDPNNLMLMTQSEHIKLHLAQGGGYLC